MERATSRRGTRRCGRLSSGAIELLSPSAQALFERLAVFAGGFRLDAADAVGSPGDVLEDLSVLVDSSLLRRGDDPDGESRFGMLQTIREYAAELLRDRGEDTQAAARHAEHYLRLAETASPALWTRAQQDWFDRLEWDHDNLRSALAFLTSRGSGDSVRLAAALAPYWEARGYVTEARSRLRSALAASAGGPLAARAAATFFGSRMAGLQGDRDDELRLLIESVRLYRAAGDVRGEIFALSHLGTKYAESVEDPEVAEAGARSVGARAGARRRLDAGDGAEQPRLRAGATRPHRPRGRRPADGEPCPPPAPR